MQPENTPGEWSHVTPIQRTLHMTRVAAPRRPGAFTGARRILQPGAFPPWPQAAPATPRCAGFGLAANYPTRVLRLGPPGCERARFGAARAPLRNGAPAARICLKQGLRPAFRPAPPATPPAPPAQPELSRVPGAPENQPCAQGAGAGFGGLPRPAQVSRPASRSHRPPDSTPRVLST